MAIRKGTSKKSGHRTSSKSEKVVSDPLIPIVGIGASAGGLEALEAFFSNLPNDSNFAFVVIQHLAPGHKSMMDSLLAKYTKMGIAQITDKMRIQPNTIYLGPPDGTVEIEENTFQLQKNTVPRATNLPIDHFFRSLSENRGERAICIVLSGTGTDGTSGLRAIKSSGGMAIVQKEDQAKYAGMPKSAIDTGLVDFVLPLEKMPEQLAKYIKHPYIAQIQVGEQPEKPKKDAINEILLMIRARTGHDFTAYKQTTIRRRIERRLAINGIQTIAGYAGYLEHNTEELDALFSDLLIGVTRFFRDPESFEALERKVLPIAIDKKGDGEVFRIWVVGCATGEEAYSLAILLTELIEKSGKDITLQIFASDIDAKALEYARKAIYPDTISADVTLERLRRFFVKDGELYRIKKQIRDCVIFALHDVTKDPPFSKINLVSCRNLLIYMENPLQEKVLAIFHYSLIEKGILFLGLSESVGSFIGDYKAINPKFRIFQKLEGPTHISTHFNFRESSPAREPVPEIASAISPLRTLGAKVIADQYAPPSVLVNEKLELLQLYGNVARYLTLGSGEASLNILHIARSGLRHKLAAMLTQAFHEDIPVINKGIRLKSGGSTTVLDLIVQPLSELRQIQRLMLVVFNERTQKSENTQTIEAKPTLDEPVDVASLEQELKATKEYLQTTIEELQTSNEELRSVNEEMQSTNEELETSREELQSTNEELVTVNSELQSKVDELMHTSNDLNNLLSSTDIATIFLDTEMRIKRFSPTAVEIFHLQQNDLGRPIRDITTKVVSLDIYQSATVVLNTLVRQDTEARTDDGKWYAVRIAPYRTVDNTIEGVVLTFSEISKLKHTLQDYVTARSLAESIVESIPTPFIVLDTKLTVRSANELFFEVFRVSSDETIGKSLPSLGSGQWKIPQLISALEEIIQKNTRLVDFIVEYEFPKIGHKKMVLNASRIKKSDFVYLRIDDITSNSARRARRTNA